MMFMLLKAGLIVAVFMHMAWERLALVYAILVPPLLLLVLCGIGAGEADYTFLTRGTVLRCAGRRRRRRPRSTSSHLRALGDPAAWPDAVRVGPRS